MPAKRVILRAMEVIFEVRDADEGGYRPRALGHAIFTEGDTWEELRAKESARASLVPKPQ
jgi:hypothetical protein